MNKFDQPPAAKLVCGILYREDAHLIRATEDLTTEFGDIDFRSPSLNFRYTDYYFKQMGEPLYRVFVSFTRLIDPASLVELKLTTNRLEEKYMEIYGSRVLNLDPGYLTAASYILATSKNYAHRIYLGRGIFAQQELLFERKRIVTLEWTYPDYRSYEYQEIFRKIRDIFKKQSSE